MAGRAQAPNFKLDVNRTKTQRWVEAKKADYGGDDWGGYDEFEDVEEEEPIPSPPPPKVTGLRQRGQGSRTSAEPPPAPPKAASPSVAQQPTFQRRSSFEAGDDRRDLSARSSANAPLAPEPKQQPRRSPVASQEPFAPPPESRRSPQPQHDAAFSAVAERRVSPPPAGAPPRGQDGRPANQYPAISTNLPPPGPRPPRDFSPGAQGRYYARDRAPSATSGPSSADPALRHDMSPLAPPQPPAKIRGSPSQELKPLPAKTSQEFRSPEKREHPAFRGPPPGHPDYRGPPRREHPDYRGPPSRDGHDYRGPPPSSRDGHDYRPPPRGDPRGDPRADPRDYRGPPYGPPHGPPHGAPRGGPRGPPPGHPDYRGPPSGPPRGGPYDPRGPPPDPRGAGGPRGPPAIRKNSEENFRPRKQSLTSPRRPQEAPPNEFISFPVELEASEPPARTPASPQPDLEADDPSSPAMVRPADIYKRVNEEKVKERLSMESGGRPSMDSVDRAARPGSRGNQAGRPSMDSLHDADSQQRLKPSLDPVAERKSEYGLDGLSAGDPGLAAALASHINVTPPLIPQFDRFSGFGLDLGWDGTSSTSQAERQSTLAAPNAVPAAKKDPSPLSQASSTPADPTLQHQPSLGLRTAVNSAFDVETDAQGLRGLGSQRSAPGADVSRSNTDSTSGISPIMSRVPSAATVEQRANERAEKTAATPAIMEDHRENESRPNSSATLKAAVQEQGDALSRARKASATSSVASVSSAATARQFSSPEPAAAPVHTAAISARKAVEHSHEAQLAVASPTEGTTAGLPVRTGDRSLRESDLADAAKESEAASPQLGAEERQAQSSFARAHPADQGLAEINTQQSPPPESPASRSASAKGRVQELASKFNDLHDRASPTSSVSSWTSSAKPSREDLKATMEEQGAALGIPAALMPRAPTKTPEQRAEEEAAERELRPPTRPSLPGQWVSENNSDNTNGPSRTGSEAHDDEARSLKTIRDRSPGDISPSTAKQPLAGQSFEDTAQNPIAKLAAAGNALAINLQESMAAKRSTPSPNTDGSERDTRGRSSTDATARGPVPGPVLPVPLKQAPLSSASSKPPTPPAKDDPYDRDGAPQRSSGYFPHPPPLHVSNPDRPSVHSPEQVSASSTFSETSSTGDMESDRLRKDIYKTLSPTTDTSTAAAQSGRETGLAPPEAALSRDSSASIIPHEYDAYWNRTPSRDDSRRPSAIETGAPREAPATQVKEEPRPPPKSLSSPATSPPIGSKSPQLTSRFSWEETAESSFLTSPTSAAPERPSLDPAADARVSEERSASSESARGGELESGPSSPTGLRQSLPKIDTSPVELEGDDQATSLRGLSPTPIELPTRSDSVSQGGSRVASESKPVPPSPAAAHSPQAYRSASQSQQPQQQIPSFRGAAGAKTPRDRAGAYEAAQRETAAMETGLGEWLAFMVQRHPEHAAPGFGGARPSAANAGSASTRAKPPGQGAPDLQKATSEFMHTAGMLGGKASQGAKGLFAKGRSRFRRGSVERTE